MYPMEMALLHLLKGWVKLDDVVVPVIRRYAPVDQTPCITVVQADETHQNRRYTEYEATQCIQHKYSSNLWINIWCRKEEERHELISQVWERILQAEANHYSTCGWYHDGLCSALNDGSCEALTRDTNRTGKGQCPNLDVYRSFFRTWKIIKNTFYIDSVTDMDELDVSEPVLRSIVKLKMDYYTYHVIGGRTFTDIEDDIR